MPQIIKHLQAQDTPGVALDTIDGVRVKTADGWWLILSNTQNVLVIRAKHSAEGLERLINMACTEVARLGYQLNFLKIRTRWNAPGSSLAVRMASEDFTETTLGAAVACVSGNPDKRPSSTATIRGDQHLRQT
ncbi:MAG: hypothetical protein R3D66_05185 [Alphaproteobacteria bacterium]